MNVLGVWVHSIDPYAIMLWEGGPIRWYGLSYLFGFYLCYLLMRRVTRVGQSTLDKEACLDLIFYIVMGVILGGRLGYVLLYKPHMFITFTPSFPFWDVLALHKGGMASHGAMLGLIISGLLFARRRKHDFGHIMDLIAFGAPLGLFFGRLANFVNGELYGRGPTDVPWAVKFPREITATNFPREKFDQLPALIPHLNLAQEPDQWDTLLTAIIDATQNGNQALIDALAPLLTARHPSQVYEALLEGLLLFAVLAIVWMKPRKPMFIAGLFGVVYGIVRIIGEQFREPDEHIGFDLLGLTRGQWLSIGLMALGIALYVVWNRKPREVMGSWRPLKLDGEQSA